MQNYYLLLLPSQQATTIDRPHLKDAHCAEVGERQRV